jgi:AcrR family transcriptional regulator
MSLQPKKVPRQARAHTTFDAIVDAAARILEREGYPAATTNRIAVVAGVSIGSLYEYFPDKETIVAEVVRRLLREVMQELTDGLSVALTRSLHAGLRGWIHQMFDCIETRRALVRAIVNEVPFLDEIEEARRFPEDLFALARLVRPHVKRTPFTSDASLYLLSTMVYHAVLDGALRRPAHLMRKDVEETLAQMLLTLLAAHGIVLVGSPCNAPTPDGDRAPRVR